MQERGVRGVEKEKSSAAQSLEQMIDFRIRKILVLLEAEEKKIIPDRKYMKSLYIGLNAAVILKVSQNWRKSSNFSEAR